MFHQFHVFSNCVLHFYIDLKDLVFLLIIIIIIRRRIHLIYIAPFIILTRFKSIIKELKNKNMQAHVTHSKRPLSFLHRTEAECYIPEMRAHTFCTANGSLCSWSRYFSRLKKVSKNMWAMRQRFRSPRVILPGGETHAHALRLGRLVPLNNHSVCVCVCVLVLTRTLRFDQVEHLAQQILEGQRFDAHPFHPLALLLVEILQLEHGQDAVAIHVHAAEPVLQTGDGTNAHGVTHHTQTHTQTEKVEEAASSHRPSPGEILLVLFGHEEPDELGVAHPAFPLHGVAPGNKRGGGGGGVQFFRFKNLSDRLHLFVGVSTHRVTAPENNLSMIRLEEAVGGGEREQ